MRIDKKTLTKGTLILLSSITIIPNMVLASEATVIDDTHYYNNYYFFNNKYTNCQINTKTCGGKTSTGYSENTTYFDALNFGYSNTKDPVKIDLKNGKSNTKEIDTYTKFYDMLLYLEEYGIPKTYYVPNKSLICESKTKYKTEGNTTNTYFAHGCYTQDGEWTVVKSTTEPLIKKHRNKEALNCASFYVASTAEIEPQDGNVFAKIKRDDTEFPNFRGWKFNANMSNCGTSQNEIKPVKEQKSTFENEVFSVYSPALYKLSYEVNKHTCQGKNMDTASMKCNNTLSVEETCPNQTMINEDVNIKQDISITQNHYASNILTPTTIHQGGGVKFAVEYYSEIKWSPSDRNNVSGAIGDLNSQEVINYINNKELYKGNDINATIKVFQIDKNNNKKTVAEIPAEKQCTIEGWSKDNGVNLLKRKCTFSMPNYELSQYDGKVTLSNDEPSSNGVNNRYYTDLNFDGKYEFEFKISNISMLKKEYDWLKKNSDTITVKSDNEDASCQVETVPVNDFVYRPIDLDKPFPNRTPGLNWLEWYSNSTNKERLKEAYDKNNLQYLAVLNNQNVMAIKGYNKNNKYLDWSDIDSDGNSTFITKNKNIVTRQSSTEEGGS